MQNIEPFNSVNSESIFYAYKELFPNDFEFLVLYHLYSNYPSAEIQHAEIKQAIVDTSKLPYLDTGKERQTEKITKSLLRTFIERVPGKFNHFILTSHAERIIELVINRINNPYLRFPLKETFEMFFKLPDDIGQGIIALQRWHKFGFQNNARQMVTGHLDGLKLAVDDAIKALNRVLEADDLSAMQMLEEFSNNFQILGEKARQITDAIKMKVEVHYKLRNIVHAFIDSSEKELQPESTLNKIQHLAPSQQDIDTVVQIKEEVDHFFEKIDKQLDLISMKMAFAANKITELQESLRVQSKYKINLKKMLAFLLENSSSDIKNWIKLPDKFPARGIVQDKFRFMTLRYYDLGFLKRAKPYEQETDNDYEESQRHHFESELKDQALIREHCERAQQLLDTEKKLNVTNYIFDILKNGSLEVGMQTGYELIRNIDESNNLEITEELLSNNTNSIHLWKVVVQNNKDSVS